MLGEVTLEGGWVVGDVGSPERHGVQTGYVGTSEAPRGQNLGDVCNAQIGLDRVSKHDVVRRPANLVKNVTSSWEIRHSVVGLTERKEMPDGKGETNE